MTEESSMNPSSPGEGGPELPRPKLKDIMRLPMPSEEEIKRNCAAMYAQISHTYIDQWPTEVAALSMPTKLVPVDPAVMVRLWNEPPDFQVAADIAQALDDAMGWTEHFVRLNSRSPKDAAPADGPITCSGKQAVAWIMASERCLDDTTLVRGAEKPLFICLREWRPMHRDGEFRCFAKDGKVIGVSRYFYNETPEHTIADDLLWSAASSFYDKHLSNHYLDIVFDLYAPGTDRGFLIEINPYGMSDPCLFGSYAELEATGGVRQVPPPPESPRPNTSSPIC